MNDCFFSDGSGRYAAMDKSDTRAGYRARLVSPYINTTGKCLELFYWIREDPSDDVETRLKIIAISEDRDEEVLDTISNLTPNFPKLHKRLPPGMHRVAIEGERTKERKLCALSLDDVTIMDCDRFGKMNAEIKLQKSLTLHSSLFLADRTGVHNMIDYWHDTLVYLSVRLCATKCTGAKRYIINLQQKCLNK